MNTAIHSDVPILKNEADFTSAPASVVKRVQNEILISIQDSPNTILLTGKPGKGKSTLLRTIANKVSVSDRLIYLHGSDLNSPDSGNNSDQDNDFSIIKELIHESALLGEELTVIIDSVDDLPTELLLDLLNINEQLAYSDNGISLILGGSPKLKKQLEKIEGVALDNIVHCSLDELNETDIRIYSTKKDYRIKPINGELQFDRSSLGLLTDYASRNLQLLDVLLEWCSALAYKNKTSAITEDIVDKAMSFAKQSAKNSGAQVEDSYPTQKEIKRLTASSTSKEKQNSNLPLIHTNNTKDKIFPSTVLPKITASDNNTTPDYFSNEIADLEEEVMPTQWVPSNTNSGNKNTSVFFRSLTPLLVIGLLALIYFQIKPVAINSDTSSPIASNNETDLNEQLTENSINEDTINNEITPSNTIAENDISTPVEPQIEAEETQATLDLPQAKEIDLDTDEKIEIVNASKSPDADEVLAKVEEVKIENESELAKNQTLQAKVEDLQTPVDQSIQSIDKQVIDTTDNPEVLRLLEIASQQFEAKNLTTPPGNNALETYRSILSKYPNHSAAQQGIQSIHDRYVSWAHYYMRNNNRDRSIYFFGKAIEVYPDDEVSRKMLLNLDAQVKQPASNQAEIAITNIATEPTTSSHDNNLLVGELLIKAKQQLQNKNLTSPPNNNAFETYKRVLQADPDNAVALQGLFMIKKSYIHWAEQDLRNNNPHRATLFYKKALAIDPADTQLVLRLEEIRSIRNR